VLASLGKVQTQQEHTPTPEHTRARYFAQTTVPHRAEGGKVGQVVDIVDTDDAQPAPRRLVRARPRCIIGGGGGGVGWSGSGGGGVGGGVGGGGGFIILPDLGRH
jgi:hypothetical protein